MPALTPDQWEELRGRARAGESVADLGVAFGVHRRTIERRLQVRAPVPKAKPRRASRPPAKLKTPPRKAGPGPKRASAKAPTLAARRKLLSRLYQAIDTKLRLMETRMHSEITALEASKPGASADAAGLSPADHERETRAFGALVKTINSVKDMQAELDRIATGTADTATDARLAADADRYRRDIAERLARFVPPGT